MVAGARGGNRVEVDGAVCWEWKRRAGCDGMGSGSGRGRRGVKGVGGKWVGEEQGRRGDGNRVGVGGGGVG